MSKFTGVLIDEEGNISPYYVNDWKDIQAAVGGHFDVVTSASGETSFWLHDEGKILGLKINKSATRLLWKLNPAFDSVDVLVGPILISGGADHLGDTLSIGAEGKKAINDLL